MKYENKYGLPKPMVEALSFPERQSKPNHISVTEMIQPPRIRQLTQLHRDEIVQDVSDNVWALLGQSVHAVLERADSADILVEEQLSFKLEGYTVTGRPDLLEGETLSDYKVTSVWSFLLGDKPEWEQQLNCYRLLYEKSGFRVKRLQIVAILRDWSSGRAMREDDYPRCPVHVQSIPVWDEAKTLDFIRDRLTQHCEARVKLPQCSPSDRWSKPTTYAVMMPKRKRALRVLGSKAEAQQWINGNAAKHGRGLYIQERPGESTRCERYCPVAEHCSQWAELKKES